MPKICAKLGPVAESLSTKIMHKKSALKCYLEADFCRCCTKTVYSKLFVRQALQTVDNPHRYAKSRSASPFGLTHLSLENAAA